MKAGYMLIRCLKGHESEGVVGWTVGKDPVSLGKLGNFFPILKRAEYSYCAGCGLIIVDIPLILWGPNAPRKVDWEIDFCFGCVEKLGVMKWLHPTTIQLAPSGKLVVKPEEHLRTFGMDE